MMINALKDILVPDKSVKKPSVPVQTPSGESSSSDEVAIAAQIIECRGNSGSDPNEEKIDLPIYLADEL